MTTLPRELYFIPYHNEFIAYTPTKILAHGPDRAAVSAEATAMGVPYEIVYCRFTPAADAKPSLT